MARPKKPKTPIDQTAVTITETPETGRIVRNAAGQFLPGTRPPNAITPATAREMAEKRAEKYRRAAVTRIAGELAAIDPTIQTPADAYGFIAARQAVALLDSDRPKLEDLQRLRDLMTGIDATKRQMDQPQATETADIIRSLAQFAASIIPNNTHYMESSQTIDAEFLQPPVLQPPGPARMDTSATPQPAGPGPMVPGPMTPGPIPADHATGPGPEPLPAATDNWEQET